MKVNKREDRQMVTINDTRIRADEFAFDGCHKIYIVTDQKSRDELESYGYEFLPISELQGAWDISCGLRFINEANLNAAYVPQGWDDDNREPRISV